MFTTGETLNVEQWPDSFHSCSLFWFVRNFLHYCFQFDTVWAEDDNENGITDDELKILSTIESPCMYVQSICHSQEGTTGRWAKLGM